MKVLLRKEICESHNQYTDPLESIETRFSMKKEKLETLNVDCTIAVGLTYENAKRQNARIETLFKWVLRVDTAYFAEN